MYEDIINMPRPVSQKHAPMTLYNRAAQFAPFSALTGLDDEMAETARLTDTDTELTEDFISELNQTICRAMEEERPVTVTFFVPDHKKSGGSYRTATASIKKADPIEGTLLLCSGICIPLCNIKELNLNNGGEQIY